MKSKILRSNILVLSLVFIFTSCDWNSHKTSNKNQPYTGEHFHLTCDSTSLFWFDAIHSNDINEKMFVDLEKEFDDFSPDLLLVEGGYDKVITNTKEEAIAKGESAFSVFLANKSQVTTKDIEPPFSTQIAYLQSKYASEEILTMYLIRQLGSIQAAPVKEEFDLESLLIEETRFFIKNGLNIDSTSLSLEQVFDIMNKYLPKKINSDNWNDQFYPRIYAKKGGALYAVYNDVVQFRNIYLIDFFKEQQQEYNRIFIVMGKQHLQDTKEELLKIYNCAL